MFRLANRFNGVLALTSLMLVTGGVHAQVTGSNETKAPASISRDALSASFAEVAAAVQPAVVSIDTKGKMPEVTARGGNTPEDSDDIMEFFRRQLPRRPASGVGSGFIVDKRGYILTNAHVVEDASRIVVKLDSGKEFPATVVGTDNETDVAVLKIDAGTDLPAVKLADSEKARVGEWVLAIGSPFGLVRTVTAGIVSQTRRETPYASPFQRFIQTDAAINKGNSGGPLVNMNGEVIGINSQIATSTGDYNGVGFALPSNEAGEVFSHIMKYGKVRRGFLGVSLESVKEEYAKVYGLADSNGAIVTEVRDKLSPAGMAGLKAGDVIIAYNGAKVENATDLIAKVSGTLPDQAVNVEFLREAGSTVERKTASIKVSERKVEERAASAASDTRRKLPVDRNAEEEKPFGLTLTELTPSLATTYKVTGQTGLVVKEVNPASYIADVKMSNGADALSEGDLIQRINRTSVTSLASFNTAVRKLKTGDAVVMEVLAYSTATRTPQLKIVQFTVQ